MVLVLKDSGSSGQVELSLLHQADTCEGKSTVFWDYRRDACLQSLAASLILALESDPDPKEPQRNHAFLKFYLLPLWLNCLSEMSCLSCPNPGPPQLQSGHGVLLTASVSSMT
jgi:hypothetical protein